jgi:hypothetical protein
MMKTAIIIQIEQLGQYGTKSANIGVQESL